MKLLQIGKPKIMLESQYSSSVSCLTGYDSDGSNCVSASDASSVSNSDSSSCPAGFVSNGDGGCIQVNPSTYTSGYQSDGDDSSSQISSCGTGYSSDG